MNLLAHAVLAHAYLPGKETLCGALMGDFLGSGGLTGLTDQVALGVRQHWMIDEVTDGHKDFRALSALLREGGAPRFTAGILVDIFWDHILAQNWETYGKPLCQGLELKAFTAQVYTQVLTVQPHFSTPFARVFPWISSMDWLYSYREVEGIAMALEGLSERVSRGKALKGCEALLLAHKDAITGAFASFWPDLCAQCDQWEGVQG